MLAREEFGLRGDIQSDAASVLGLTQAALQFEGLRFMRDPTRGGLATVCTELHRATGIGVRLAQTSLPVRDPVQSVCDMLGYDPMYLACEGRVVAVVDAEQADRLLESWQGSDGMIYMFEQDGDYVEVYGLNNFGVVMMTGDGEFTTSRALDIDYDLMDGTYGEASFELAPNGRLMSGTFTNLGTGLFGRISLSRLD